MNEEEEDVVLLERPVIFIEPDDLVDDDHVGFEDVTTEYVLAQVDNDYDEVRVEEPEEVVLVDIERIDVDGVDFSKRPASDIEDDAATLELEVA
jgi:hypothetical protein